MRVSFKAGFNHYLLLTVTIIILLLLTLVFRRYIYFAYQHLGAKVGLNFNNIASQKYAGWIKSQSGDFENDGTAIFLNKNTTYKDIVVIARSDVLGQSTASSDEKRIEISLSEQRLYLKEGNKTVGSFLVSTGKWAPTPQGEWRIWTKLRYTRMKGGSKALGTFYDLPNVPYTMYYNQGYGIHGAYWHNNFGHPMSHGCVNMKPEEAGIVYNWASVGTKVVVRS